MLMYVARRLGHAVLVVGGVVALTFFIVRVVPGDPARLMVPPGTDEAIVEELRTELGTDQPLLNQFSGYLADLARGDLGDSFRADQPVSELIAERFPATLGLTAATVATAVIVALPLGLAAALHPGSWLDRATLTIATGVQSMPSFWLGIMLVFLFSVHLQLLPAIGMTGPASFILPTVTLAAVLTAVLMRTVRQSMIEALNSDFARSGIARGLPMRRIVLVHALKNASLPIITVIGIQTGFVLGGTFVVELIFNWPGVGLAALNAIQQRDFPVVQGVVIVVAIAFVAVNLIVDLAYAVLDPRVRLGVEGGRAR